MNDRIKELAEQAGYSKDYLEIGLPSNMEKFAQLIVKECAELATKKAFVIMQKAEEYAADKEEMIDATSAAFQVGILGEEIREHFGVEE